MFYEPLKCGDSTIAIIDGYSGGRYFAKKLCGLGYDCIHIQSTKIIPAIYQQSFQPQDYSANIIYSENNLMEVLQQLSAHKVSCVIVGAETGVELADLLSERLGLVGNGTCKSEARRNKYKMIEALKEQGLQTVSHIKTSNLKDALDFADSVGKWPIVAKQVRGGGAENLFFCRSKHEIEAAFKKIIGVKDAFDQINHEVLLESYLDGIHYVINMVSVNGQHILSDLWDVARLPATGVVYDYQRILPCSYYRKEALVEYTRRVLDALEIKHGASHNEVIWTKSGPVLVESAARIMGVMPPYLISECIGRSQLELTIASYLQPERFRADDLCDYAVKKHIMFKFLVAGNSGIIKNIKFLEAIKALKSFAEMSLKVSVGDRLLQTVDLFTSPGLVCLCHEDEQIILRDHAKISELEKNMFEVY